MVDCGAETRRPQNHVDLLVRAIRPNHAIPRDPLEHRLTHQQPPLSGTLLFLGQRQPRYAHYTLRRSALAHGPLHHRHRRPARFPSGGAIAAPPRRAAHPRPARPTARATLAPAARPASRGKGPSRNRGGVRVTHVMSAATPAISVNNCTAEVPPPTTTTRFPANPSGPA